MLKNVSCHPGDWNPPVSCRGRLSTQVVNCRDRWGPGLNLDLRDLYHLLCHHSRWHLRFNSPIAKRLEKNDAKTCKNNICQVLWEITSKLPRQPPPHALALGSVEPQPDTKKKNIKTRVCSPSQKKKTPHKKKVPSISVLFAPKKLVSSLPSGACFCTSRTCVLGTCFTNGTYSTFGTWTQHLGKSWDEKSHRNVAKAFKKLQIQLSWYSAVVSTNYINC